MLSNVRCISWFNVLKKFQRTLYVKNCSANYCTENSLKIPFLTQFTDDEINFRLAARKFAREQVAPLVTKMDEEEKLDDKLFRDLFRNGFMGIEIDEEFGGAGANFMSIVLIIEEFSKICAGVAGLVCIQNSVITKMFNKLGTEEQKQKYLPKLTQECIGSFALSEVNSGSDAFAMQTTAKKDGDHYIINGSKIWTSNADMSEVYLVFANANPSKGYKGITVFIVDKETEGLSIGKKQSKLGIRAWTTSEVHLENVRVPKENILGELGQGYKHAATLLNGSRIGIAAQMVGIAQGCLDATIPYMLERKQFGQDIFSFQGVQHQVASIVSQIQAARLLTYNAARLRENGKPYKKEASMAKFFSSEVAQQTTVKCIDWMGGVGFTKDFPQEKFYRDVKVGSIYEGSTNIQLNTIAKCIKEEYTP